MKDCMQMFCPVLSETVTTPKATSWMSGTNFYINSQNFSAATDKHIFRPLVIHIK